MHMADVSLKQLVKEKIPPKMQYFSKTSPIISKKVTKI